MKEFIEDNDEYTELGELHIEQNKAVIGRIDSRYENNRKHSLLPVDSSRRPRIEHRCNNLRGGGCLRNNASPAAAVRQ